MQRRRVSQVPRVQQLRHSVRTIVEARGHALAHCFHPSESGSCASRHRRCTCARVQACTGVSFVPITPPPLRLGDTAITPHSPPLGTHGPLITHSRRRLASRRRAATTTGARVYFPQNTSTKPRTSHQCRIARRSAHPAPARRERRNETRTFNNSRFILQLSRPPSATAALAGGGSRNSFLAPQWYRVPFGCYSMAYST